VRLRCYLPSTSAIVIILIVGFLLLRHAATHTFAAAGVATMVVMAVGAAGLVAGTIAVSAVTIRRRRAAAGACHTCSHPCREAMVPLPEFDAPLWPHRPLSSSGGAQDGQRAGAGLHLVAGVPRKLAGGGDGGVVAVQLDEPGLGGLAHLR
jgi:hypothetical protein